ncbi:methyltransferase family protein [Flavobacteriaceae bacterium 14752]|uniref:methyltransferase family protein n=1 Tax=Mesohalobacter salilacus TaxID=2491711 RepID=UPI000F640CFB|nr:isoprenylcysteine carboxylmethyltransferase family protein [Flavobacteriaceae bacterium 14752]
MKPKSLKDIVFVGLQFLLLIAFIIDIQIYTLPDILPDFVYGFLSAIALAIFISSILKLNTNLSPFPSPKTNSKLITSGIFKYIRHPIYTALILGLLSWSLYKNSLFQLCTTLALIVLFYFKSKFEEQQLLKKFPRYKSYMKSSGRFLPKTLIFNKT